MLALVSSKAAPVESRNGFGLETIISGHVAGKLSGTKIRRLYRPPELVVKAPSRYVFDGFVGLCHCRFGK